MKPNTDSKNHLRKVVDGCLAALHKNDFSQGPVRRQVPIREAIAEGPLDEPTANLQKRALANAADALAALWGVSSPRRPLVPNRTMKFAK
jgi:hypothetical protein